MTYDVFGGTLNPAQSNPTSQTERQTTCDRKTALCIIAHRAVKIERGVQPHSAAAVWFLCMSDGVTRLVGTVLRDSE